MTRVVTEMVPCSTSKTGAHGVTLALGSDDRILHVSSPCWEKHGVGDHVEAARLLGNTTCIDAVRHVRACLLGLAKDFTTPILSGFSPTMNERIRAHGASAQGVKNRRAGEARKQEDLRSRWTRDLNKLLDARFSYLHAFLDAARAERPTVVIEVTDVTGTREEHARYAGSAFQYLVLRGTGLSAKRGPGGRWLLDEVPKDRLYSAIGCSTIRDRCDVCQVGYSTSAARFGTRRRHHYASSSHAAALAKLFREAVKFLNAFNRGDLRLPSTSSGVHLNLLPDSPRLP